MAAFSFPPARGRGGRPGPQRVQSGGAARASPYQRPSSGASGTDGKWQHDLFSEGSSLYTPAVNTQALKSKLHGWQDEAPSASLRPFGAATPAAAPLRVALNGVGAATNGGRPQAQAQAPTGPRLGIKGGADMQAQRRREQEARLAAQKEREEMIKRRKEQEAERQKVVRIAQEEEKGFVVQVEGLVQGTSAEDVQTAFGSYGEISFCFVVDESAADLVARLTFAKYSDAAEACSKLDGAIADGRPLRVQHVSRTPQPASLPPLPKVAAPVATVAPTGPRAQAGVPSGPRGGRRAARQAAVPAPPPIPSKMVADEIEAAEAAALASAMDVDMTDAPSAPTGPRNTGRGRGRGGAAPPAVPAAPPSLAQRLAGATPPSGPAAQRGGKQQQQQASSLAARLGVQNGGGSAAAGAPGGKGKKAKGGKDATQGSLLARLA
ncbi:hypothetical protein JCM10213_004874 [Rhodosporidiobolus nylandii]